MSPEINIHSSCTNTNHQSNRHYVYVYRHYLGFNSPFGQSGLQKPKTSSDSVEKPGDQKRKRSSIIGFKYLLRQNLTLDSVSAVRYHFFTKNINSTDQFTQDNCFLHV